MQKRSKSYYAVAVGITPGIYRDWESAKKQVKNFKNCVYKKFETESAATEFLKLHCNKNSLTQLDLVKMENFLSSSSSLTSTSSSTQENISKFDKLNFIAVGYWKSPLLACTCLYFGENSPENKIIKYDQMKFDPSFPVTNTRIQYATFLLGVKFALDNKEKYKDTNVKLFFKSSKIHTMYKNLEKWKSNLWHTHKGIQNSDIDLLETISRLQYQDVSMKFVPEHYENHFYEKAIKLCENALE